MLARAGSPRLSSRMIAVGGVYFVPSKPTPLLAHEHSDVAKLEVKAFLFWKPICEPHSSERSNFVCAALQSTILNLS
jgi:hypothetical protein